MKEEKEKPEEQEDDGQTSPAVPEKKIGWNPIQSGRTVQDGSSTSSTDIRVDTSGWDKPTEYRFTAPVREEPKLDLSKGFWNAIMPDKPRFDTDRAQRLENVAKMNAFGDFVKHLAAFSGHGYAPTEKRQENTGTLRAFQDLDRMRDIYDAKEDRYNNIKLSTQIQDLAYQRGKADEDYRMKYAAEKEKAGMDWKAREGLRANREQAHYAANTSKTNTQHGETDQFKNLDLIMAENAAKRKGSGSGKDESFNAYIQGVGDLNINKSAQIQIGTRIKDAMLNAGLISEKDAAGLMTALASSNSRNAFQSMLGYLRYTDVWDACKPFLGHGMEITRPDKEGYPTDNRDKPGSPSAEGASSGGSALPK